MRPAQLAGDRAPRWEIATPSRPGRLPGVRMAGFRAHHADGFDLRLVPHPAVTVFIDFGDGLLTDEASGQSLAGSVAAGLAPGAVFRGRGRDIECLQVRVSPVVAHEVLGASSPELGGTVVALDDLWGRDGAASGCGPGSGPRSASPPSAPCSSSASTTPPISWPPATAPP